MKIDVDDILRRVLPWECELTIGGEVHRVRPPTLADVDAISKFQANQSLSEQDAAKMIEDLFEDPKPKLVGATFPVFNLVAQAVTHYIVDYISKKNQRLLLEEAGLIKKAETSAISPGTLLTSSSESAQASQTP